MRCDNNIHKKYAISPAFKGKRGKRLIVVAAERRGGATVRCKQNASGYRICELFFTASRIEGNNYQTPEL